MRLDRDGVVVVVVVVKKTINEKGDVWRVEAGDPSWHEQPEEQCPDQRSKGKSPLSPQHVSILTHIMDANQPLK